jgi:trimeric autotransporter adhesin
MAGRGGFMRRLLTLVSLLSMAIPAGISISGCTRNPAANYCNGLGYGLKITDVASIQLQPQTAGISLAFGQEQQIAGPTAKTCKGATATVTTYTYGTTNNQLVDISPTGNICAGTWNRNTGGGIANYTYCNFPSPLPNTSGVPYGTAFITASANGVTSNPVEVYIHPQVTSVSLVGPPQCLSQGQLYSTSAGTPIPLDAQACYSGKLNGALTGVQLCAPAGITKCPYTATDPRCSDASKYFVCPLPTGVTSLPTCPNSIGALSFTVGTAAIASINNVNNEITAEQPGTTVITASVAGSGSAAGYFSTCPPKSITVTLANGSTNGIVTQGVQQNLVTTVTDTNNNPITGLTLDYQSTNPLDILAASGGGITANFPGTASIYAVCQPSTCNPSPINQVGLNNTGVSISSNPVTVTVPGTASSYMWFAAPGKSQYFVPIELLTGTPGSTVRLPYVPNSMIMDQLGDNLYFGSAHELMIYSTTNNAISKEDPTVPGVVLAVSPNNTQLLINDQVRHVFYLYNASGTIAASYGGVGNAAAFTPDSKTLYISDSASLGAGHSDTLYVYNVNSNWTTYDLSSSGGATNLALTVPGVGAYLSGSPTVAHTWCPTGTAATAAGASPGSVTAFYPQGDSVDAVTEALAATTDGRHILGAALSTGGMTFSDIGITIPTVKTTIAGNPNSIQTPVPCGQTGSTLDPLLITHTLNQVQIAANATAVNQVITSPPPTLVNGSTSQAPSFAFITYDGATPGATLPYYVPSTTSGAIGTLGYVTLKGASAITAPIAGAFSPDNTLFFVSTAGDNKIHYISIPVAAGAVPTDTQQLSPNLPACVPQSASDPYCTNTTVPAGGFVPATAIAVKPRSTT